MNDYLTFLSMMLTIALATPPVVYFSVKLGTYAFFRAVWLFQIHHPDPVGDDDADQS